MDETSAWVFLKSLWSGINQDELKCCHCSQRIESDASLARTFTLQSQVVGDKRQWAEKVEVPTLSDAMIVYHRHLECLFQSTQYIAISHVWDPQVADLQYRQLEATASIYEVEHTVREVPVRICRGLATSLSSKFEVWHDYISVPQWMPKLKRQIILAIPQVFNRAMMTIAYLSDIEEGSFVSMREGDSIYERCCGISSICNAKWFSRVWATMELTQSRELRAMVKDFSLIKEHRLHRPFIVELERSWREEGRRFGNDHILEQMVGIGNNLVPWQHGPIITIREENLNGVQTPFAVAHQLLARRCVTIPGDFFHAILGILKPNLTEALSHDTGKALLQIARSCMREGDLSPLFMVPASTQTELDEMDIQSSGYVDLATFALGSLEMLPTFPEAKFSLGSNNSIIEAENLGTVQFIRRVGSGGRGAAKSLSELSRLTLGTTGLDVVAFVTTLGARLYGQELDKILQRLSKEERWRQISEQLSSLYNSLPDDSEDIISWIAEAMGLSNTSLEGGPFKSRHTPMMFSEYHGDTLHLGRSGAVVGVNCRRCQMTFLLRVALLKPASQVLGTKAYRIPGLRYWFTHPGGAGFLLNGGYIVGRFVWGTPTCDCRKNEKVEVVLEDFPLPKPNNFKYGQQEKSGCCLMVVENRIK